MANLTSCMFHEILTLGIMCIKISIIHAKCTAKIRISDKKQICTSPNSSGVPRGIFGGSNPPPRNSENSGGDLDRMSKKNRRLDFLLQFTVFPYGCNLLNKGFFFNTNCLAVAYLVSEFKPTQIS